MEYARRKRRRKRGGQGAGRFMAALVTVCLIVYLVTASAAGKWLAENVMAPAFTALSELPFFGTNSLDILENEMQGGEPEDALSVSLNTARDSVNVNVEVPSISCFALQMGVFSSMENASALASELQSRGAGGYVYEDAGRYRVLASGYETEADAKTVKNRLTDEGSDCALFPISAPGVTFSITAAQAQIDEIKSSFSALCDAQKALCEACISFDSSGMSASDGAATVQSIANGLSTACSPLNAYKDSSPAIAAITSCCDKCVQELSALASSAGSDPSAFSARMKHALLALTDSYSAMLNSIAAN